MQTELWFRRSSADTIFWSKFYIQNAGVTLKMRSKSPKSNHFFPMFQWCLCASLVKIHQFIQEIKCRQVSFYNLCSVVTLKIRPRSRKLILLIISMIQYIRFGQNPSFGSRNVNVTKIQSFFPMSQWCFYASLVKIHQLVQETECRQGSFLQSL